MRYRVQDAFPGHVAGPMVLGVLTDGVIRGGETLVVESTGATVRLVGMDVHARQTDEGLELGLQLHPEDAAAVTPGSTPVSRPTP